MLNTIKLHALLDLLPLHLQEMKLSTQSPLQWNPLEVKQITLIHRASFLKHWNISPEPHYIIWFLIKYVLCPQDLRKWGDFVQILSTQDKKDTISTKIFCMSPPRYEGPSSVAFPWFSLVFFRLIVSTFSFSTATWGIVLILWWSEPFRDRGARLLPQ